MSCEQGPYGCTCMFGECDEDTNPGLALTDEERELMNSIGGIAGYFEVARRRMARISGLNSVARGIPTCSELDAPACICDRSGKYPSLATNPNEHWLSCPLAVTNAPKWLPPKCGDCGAELITIPRPDGSLIVQLKHDCSNQNFNKPRGGFEFL